MVALIHSLMGEAKDSPGWPAKVRHAVVSWGLGA